MTVNGVIFNSIRPCLFFLSCFTCWKTLECRQLKQIWLVIKNLIDIPNTISIDRWTFHISANKLMNKSLKIKRVYVRYVARFYIVHHHFLATILCYWIIYFYGGDSFLVVHTFTDLCKLTNWYCIVG